MSSETAYKLVQIDLQDLDPLAEQFPPERCAVVKVSHDLADLLVFAIYEFKRTNNIKKVKMSFSEWLNKAKDGGFEYAIFSPARREIFRVSTVFNPVTEYALYLAINYHKDQIQRINGRSFLEHPLAVANILRKSHLDFSLKDEIIAAGLCQDLLKATTCNPNEIEQACGPETLNLVKTLSDDSANLENDAWQEKKLEKLKTLKDSDVEAVVVTIADKVAVLNAFFDQFAIEGPAVWKKCSRDKGKDLWYKKELLKVAKRRWRHPLVFEYEKLLKRLEETPEV